MNTKIYEYIIEVAYSGSLSKAADKFYLSHAALSQHIKNIEIELGKPLFERLPSGMRPTKAGILFIDDAKAILRQQALLEKKLEEIRLRQRKIIRLTLDLPFYNLFILSVIPRFRQLEPEYTLEIMMYNGGQSLQKIRKDEADIALLLSESSEYPDLASRVIGQTELYLAFPKNYTGPKTFASLQDALDHQLMLALYPIGTSVRIIEDHQLAQLGIFPSATLSANFTSSVQLIACRNCCSLLPKVIIDRNEDCISAGEYVFNLKQVLVFSPYMVWSSAMENLARCITEVYVESLTNGDGTFTPYVCPR